MLPELNGSNKVIGLKQSRKAIKDGAAERVFVALDAEDKIIAPIIELCREHGVEVEKVDTMTDLGIACGIEVGAAVAVKLK